MKITYDDKNIWLNLHHLYSFYVVASEGRLENASLYLNVGKPTLSSQIKLLEETLEASLFLRTHKGLELTVQGVLVFQHAEKIFSQGKEMVLTLFSQCKKEKQMINIGIEKGVVLKAGIAIFSQLYDNNKTFFFVRDTSQTLIRALRSREIDYYVTHDLEDSLNPDLSYKEIVKSPLIISGTQKFSHFKRNFPLELNDVPLLLPCPQHPLRKEIDSFFSKNNLSIKIISESDDFNISSLMAKEGLGLLISSRIAVEDRISDGRLFELGEISHLFESTYQVCLRTNDRKNFGGTL